MEQLFSNKLVSLVNFSWNTTKRKPIAAWSLDLMLDNNLKEVFDSIKSIRGVGNKIASFYLRDIYMLSPHHIKNLDSKHLLQPIDVWTRRAGRIIKSDSNATDKQCAEALLEIEEKYGLIAGSSNVAFWVFGAKIAENEDTFRKPFMLSRKEIINN